MRRYSSVWVALFGVLVGMMAMLALQKYNESRSLLRVSGNDWRKLNLVLQTIGQ